MSSSSTSWSQSLLVFSFLTHGGDSATLSFCGFLFFSIAWKWASTSFLSIYAKYWSNSIDGSIIYRSSFHTLGITLTLQHNTWVLANADLDIHLSIANAYCSCHFLLRSYEKVSEGYRGIAHILRRYSNNIGSLVWDASGAIHRIHVDHSQRVQYNKLQAGCWILRETNMLQCV